MVKFNILSTLAKKFKKKPSGKLSPGAEGKLQLTPFPVKQKTGLSTPVKTQTPAGANISLTGGGVGVAPPPKSFTGGSSGGASFTPSNANFTLTTGGAEFVGPPTTVNKVSTNDSTSPGVSGGTNVGSQFDVLGTAAPFTAGDVLDVATLGTGGLVSGGTKLTNALAQKALKQGLIKKGSFKLQQSLGKAGETLATESVESFSPIAAKLAAGETVKASKWLKGGKAVLNSKAAKLGLNLIKKAVKNKKFPFFAMTAAVSAFGGGLYLAQQTSDDYTDAIAGINFKMAEAARAGDDEEVEFLNELYQEAIQTVDEVDGLGHFNAFAAAKFKIAIDSKLIESNYRIFNEAKKAEISKEEAKLNFEEVQTANDIKLAELKQQFALQQQQANIELQQLKDENNEKEFNRRLKLEKKKAKLYQQTQALIAEQNAKELEAELQAYIEKQKIYNEQWEAKNKYFQDNAPSSLKFGLLG